MQLWRHTVAVAVKLWGSSLPCVAPCCHCACVMARLITWTITQAACCPRARVLRRCRLGAATRRAGGGCKCTAVASQIESYLVHYVWVASTATAVVYILCLTRAAGAQPAGALACAARTQRLQSIEPLQAASIVQYGTWCWGCLDALGWGHPAAAGPEGLPLQVPLLLLA